VGSEDGSAGKQGVAGEPPEDGGIAQASGHLVRPAIHGENPPLIVQNPPFMAKTLHSWRVFSLAYALMSDPEAPAAPSLGPSWRNVSLCGKTSDRKLSG